MGKSTKPILEADRSKPKKTSRHAAVDRQQASCEANSQDSWQALRQQISGGIEATRGRRMGLRELDPMTSSRIECSHSLLSSYFAAWSSAVRRLPIRPVRLKQPRRDLPVKPFLVS